MRSLLNSVLRGIPTRSGGFRFIAAGADQGFADPLAFQKIEFVG
ncbi:MAG: hypothetical protein QM775_34830 [Pirellulales bacterium]